MARLPFLFQLCELRTPCCRTRARRSVSPQERQITDVHLVLFLTVFMQENHTLV